MSKNSRCKIYQSICNDNVTITIKSTKLYIICSLLFLFSKYYNTQIKKFCVSNFVLLKITNFKGNLLYFELNAVLKIILDNYWFHDLCIMSINSLNKYL